MDKDNILAVLEAFKAGSLGAGDAVEKLKNLPYEDLDFVKIDHHRSMRQGFAEVIFCQGKTREQVAEIVARMLPHHKNILATRADSETFAAVAAIAPDARYQAAARMIIIERQPVVKDSERFIAVMSAGTSDIPVAEEAALTAEVMGNEVRRVFDVGVAGMEGALASVVGGIAAKPVIAVPTSVGYGASFGGLAALLSMLNSCAAGVAVVNIDNGFGAGRLANMINHMR